VGKSTKSKYDPQFVAAQQRANAIAERTQAWTESFFDRWIAPLLSVQADQVGATTRRLDTMFEKNLELMQRQLELYEKYGVPSEQRYYSMFSGAIDDAQSFYQRVTRPAAETYADTLRTVSEQAMSLLTQGAIPAAQQLYRMAEDVARSDRALYETYGRPAMESFYRMAAEYSSPAEEERQAALAMGDVTQAAEVQRSAMQRRLAAAGVSPNSPQALSIAGRMSVEEAGMRAAAAEKARMAAKALGIQLKGAAAEFGRNARTGLEASGLAAEFGRGETLGLSTSAARATMAPPVNSTGLALGADLASFGRGYLSSADAFGSRASVNAAGGLGVTQSAIGSITTGAQVPLTGLGTALSGFQNNANTWLGRVKADLDMRAANARGLGEAFGGVLGLAAGRFKK